MLLRLYLPLIDFDERRYTFKPVQITIFLVQSDMSIIFN